MSINTTWFGLAVLFVAQPGEELHFQNSFGKIQIYPFHSKLDILIFLDTQLLHTHLIIHYAYIIKMIYLKAQNIL